jgi:hypothetical protein
MGGDGARFALKALRHPPVRGFKASEIAMNFAPPLSNASFSSAASARH